MDLAAQAEAIAPAAAFCVGVGLARRKRLLIGLSLVATAAFAAIALAILGSARPLLGLIAIPCLLGGIEIDRPGVASRRALALASVSVGMFALLIGYFYA